MSESLLQQITMTEARKLGYLAYKFASPSNRGVPDLILINQIGAVYFMELKNPNKRGRLSELQKAIHEDFEEHAAPVHVFDDLEKIKRFLKKHA